MTDRPTYRPNFRRTDRVRGMFHFKQTDFQCYFKKIREEKRGEANERGGGSSSTRPKGFGGIVNYELLVADLLLMIEADCRVGREGGGAHPLILGL